MTLIRGNKKDKYIKLGYSYTYIQLLIYTNKCTKHAHTKTVKYLQPSAINVKFFDHDLNGNSLLGMLAIFYQDSINFDASIKICPSTAMTSVSMCCSSPEPISRG